MGWVKMKYEVLPRGYDPGDGFAVEAYSPREAAAAGVEAYHTRRSEYADEEVVTVVGPDGKREEFVVSASMVPEYAATPKAVVDARQQRARDYLAARETESAKAKEGGGP